jgi:hypothetical protein
MNDEEILKNNKDDITQMGCWNCRRKGECSRDCNMGRITVYCLNDVFKLMALARQDEREKIKREAQLDILKAINNEDFEKGRQQGAKDKEAELRKPTEIGSCQVCGQDDAVIKAREEGRLQGAKDERVRVLDEVRKHGLKGGGDMKHPVCEECKQVGREEAMKTKVVLNGITEKDLRDMGKAYQEWCAKAQRLSERNAELEKEIAEMKKYSCEYCGGTKEVIRLHEALERIANTKPGRLETDTESKMREIAKQALSNKPPVAKTGRISNPELKKVK